MRFNPYLFRDSLLILKSKVRSFEPRYTPHCQFILVRIFHAQQSSKLYPESAEEIGFLRSVDHEFNESNKTQDELGEKFAISIQNFLKNKRESSAEVIERALDKCGILLNDDLVINVLRRHRSDWRSAFVFFNWVMRAGGVDCSYSPGWRIYNEILDILGKFKCFNELNQVLDEMKKKAVFGEKAYGIVVHRYAAAHKVEEATDFFYRRREFGLELDLIAFQTLLLALSRYKHVEVAEFLFHSKEHEFKADIKTMNIILNGWCVRGNLSEAKRFWNDIVSSKCKPGLFTYGIFINTLCKKGKLSTAVKLFRSMWEKGVDPDVTICNSIIDALCFKKKIPEALKIFEEMNERECLPDVATYNTLIKHLCKIQRMEKVYKLLDEMEQKQGSCLPNSRTYGYLLATVKKPEEVTVLIKRMENIGCKMTSDIYNMILRLYVNWDCQERVRSTWVEMEQNAMGPDQRSYTVMIHGLHDLGRIDEALRHFREMKSKGMVPEARTVLLVDAMKISLKKK